MTDEKMPPGTRVRVEFEGEVLHSYGERSLVSVRWTSGMPFTHERFEVPWDAVSVIYPPLKPGQVWVGQEGHRYFVLRTPKARMTLTTTEGKPLMPEDMDWDNLELVSDA